MHSSEMIFVKLFSEASDGGRRGREGSRETAVLGPDLERDLSASIRRKSRCPLPTLSRSAVAWTRDHGLPVCPWHHGRKMLCYMPCQLGAREELEAIRKLKLFVKWHWMLFRTWKDCVHDPLLMSRWTVHPFCCTGSLFHATQWGTLPTSMPGYISCSLPPLIALLIDFLSLSAHFVWVRFPQCVRKL